MERPFVIDPALTAMAINFTNPDVARIADEIFPRVNVGGEKYKYDYYPPEEIFTLPDTTVGRRGGVNQVEFSAEQRDASTTEYGLESPIPNSDIDAAKDARGRGDTSFDPEARAVEGIKHLIDLGREVRVAGVVSDPNTYDADKRIALTGGDKWSDENSDPIGDILRAMDQTFIAKPNIAALGSKVFTVLRQHPKVVKAAQGNSGDSGVATAEQIARLVGLQKLLVGEAWVNLAKQGQPANMQRAWGNTFALMHRASVATNDNGIPTFGITAEWHHNGSPMIAGRIPSSQGGLLGSTIVRAGERIRENLVAPSVAYLIDQPIAA